MKTQNIASLFAGAVAGITAMYLLDPEQGEKRRRMIASKAGEYWDEASDVIGDQWHHLADYAKDTGQHAYSAARGYADHLMSHAQTVADDAQGQVDDAKARTIRHAQGWVDQGRKYLNQYRDQAARYGKQAQKYRDSAAGSIPSASDVQSSLQDYGQAAWDRARKVGYQARDRAMEMINRGRKAVAPPQPSPVIPVAITALSFCALGAGVMYIVDPAKGRARRAWISDKVTSIVRRSGKTAYRKGRHWANRAYGVAAEARGTANDLIDRVNEAVRGVLQDPKVVQVMADANGKITVIGHLMADQLDRLMKAIQSVPGVTEIINRVQTMTGSSTPSDTSAHEVH